MIKRSTALMLVWLIWASACGPQSTPGGATPTGTSVASAAATPGGPPIVLGVPTDLGTIEGRDSLNAAQLAVEEINGAGGVNVAGTKRPFKIESVDTREAGADIPVNDALQANQKLIQEKKPDAIVVGAFRSEVFAAAMDLIPQYKLPYLVTIAASPLMQQKVTADPKYKYFFRLGLNAQGVAGALNQTISAAGKQFNLKKAYIVHQDVAWAAGTAAGVAPFLTQNGWEVIATDKYSIGATDFSATLNKARDQKVDVLIPIFDMPQSGILLKQIKNMKLGTLVAGFISPASPFSANKTFEGDVDGLITLYFELGGLAAKAVPASQKFLDAYGKKFGDSARDQLSAHGPGAAYDAVYVLKAAIEKAGTVEGDSVVKALETTELDGVIGHIKFGADHQAVFGTDPKTTAVAAAFQWQSGKRVIVFPPALAEGQIQQPKP